MNIRKTLKATKKKARAITPVLAILLMIVITVAAALVTYAWVMGYLGFTTSKAGRAMQVQSVAYNSTEQKLTIYVQNVGEDWVTIAEAASVYVGGILRPVTILDPTAPGEKALDVGETATIVVGGVVLPKGERVRVKVIDEIGTFTEVNTVPLTGGGAGGPLPFAYLRKSITFDHTQVVGASPLLDFPVLVSLSGDSDLQTDTHPQGWDIHFTNEAGTVQLSHEIEDFDQAAGDLVAWVKVPALSDTADTVIYMLYGDPDAVASEENVADVWSNGYEAVYHLENDFVDSTGTKPDGINSGSSDAAGKILRGRDFDGDHIDFGTWSVSGSELTVQTWVRCDNFGKDDPRFVSKANSGNEADHVFLLGLSGSGENNLRMRLRTSTTTTLIAPDSADMAAGTWTLAAITFEGTLGSNQMKILKNGVIVAQTTKTGTNLAENTWPIWAGDGYNTGGYGDMNGQLDEIRISNEVRSPGWLQTEYNNQNSPGTFFTLGSEE